MMSRHRLLQPPGRDDLPDGSGHSRADDSLPERSGAGPVLVGGRCHGHERTEDPRAGKGDRPRNERCCIRARQLTEP